MNGLAECEPEIEESESSDKPTDGAVGGPDSDDRKVMEEGVAVPEDGGPGSNGDDGANTDAEEDAEEDLLAFEPAGDAVVLGVLDGGTWVDAQIGLFSHGKGFIPPLERLTATVTYSIKKKCMGECDPVGEFRSTGRGFDATTLGFVSLLSDYFRATLPGGVTALFYFRKIGLALEVNRVCVGSSMPLQLSQITCCA